LPITEGNVLARNGDHNIEFGVIKADGTFRVMGLKPGNTYAFSVESKMVERTLPDKKSIVMASGDNTDVSFVSIEKPSTFSISGSAFFEGE